jgi:hypothetical protein
VQWPEGFRLHPNAGWDDEIKRLSEAADVFERVANVVQSHLVGAPLPTGVAVTVAKSIIDPPPGAEGMAEVLAALVEQSPGISRRGTSDSPPRLRRLSSAAWSVQLSLPPARYAG